MSNAKNGTSFEQLSTGVTLATAVFQPPSFRPYLHSNLPLFWRILTLSRAAMALLALGRSRNFSISCGGASSSSSTPLPPPQSAAISPSNMRKTRHLASSCLKNGQSCLLSPPPRSGIWEPSILRHLRPHDKETRFEATFFIERVQRSMHRIVEYEWQDALQDAVHERDPRELEGRVLRAEVAVFERVHSPCPVDSIETQALFDALKVLRLLRSSAHRATKSILPINAQRKTSAFQ